MRQRTNAIQEEEEEYETVIMRLIMPNHEPRKEDGLLTPPQDCLVVPLIFSCKGNVNN